MTWLRLLFLVPLSFVIGSVAMAAIAAWSGASIIRAHDIAETKDALRVAAALRGAREQIRDRT